MLPIFSIRSLLEKKEISYKELIDFFVDRVIKIEPKINSFITLTLNEAKTKAEKLDKDNNEANNYLTGIPISVKDTFTTKGIRTTAGSKMLESYKAQYDATSYLRLKEKDGIIFGKTNMDEFAHGFTTEYSAFKNTLNPWDLSKVPGGSSGGSAASVASGEVLLSLASENYGSIIQPSSFCGAVGIKPTYGRASRYGIIAMVSSLECPGIIGRCVEDAALGLSAIAGYDSNDASTVDYSKFNYSEDLKKTVQGKKIAIVKPIIEAVDSQISSVINEALLTFEKLGVETKLIDWYDLEIDGKIYDVLYRAEVASNLARYDGIRYGYNPLVNKNFSNIEDYYLASRDHFGRHVKRQIVTDPITLAGKDRGIYTNALKVRRKNRDYIDGLFKNYDAILTPASPFLSINIGQTADQAWREKNRKYGILNAAMLCPTALYGYPSISFPIAVKDSKTPVGVNLFSARFREQELFNLAYGFQEETGLKCLTPVIN